MKTFEKIYIEPNDEITQVIDQLAGAAAGNIVIVIPPGSQILKSAINLRLLKREADYLGKNISIVTEDPAGLKLAQKVGLSVEAAEGKEEIIREDPGEEKTAAKEEKMARRSRPIRMSDIVSRSPRKALEIKATPEKAKEVEIEIKEPKKPLKSKKILKKKKKSGAVKRREEDEISDEFLMFREAGLRQDFKDKFFSLMPQIPLSISLGKSFDYKFFLWIVGGLGAVIVGSILYMVLPRASIILDPVDRLLETDMAVVADTHVVQADLARKRIPANFIRVEKEISREFSATGEKVLNEKARGFITIYNKYSSSPQTLVEKTRFVTETTDKLFRIAKAVTIPGAKVEDGQIIPSSIEVEVFADQPGSEYNIGPSKFVIPGFKGSPKFSAFYGESKTPMTGGSIGTVKVVTKEDIEKAKNELMNELKAQLEGELKGQIPEGLKVMDSAVNTSVVEEIPSVEAGGQAERFTLKIKMVSEAMVFDEELLKELVREDIKTKIGDEEEASGASLEINYKEAVNNFEEGIISMSLGVKEKILAGIDTEEMAEQLKGKDEAGVRSVLGQNLKIEAVKMSFWPFWVKKVPVQASKIRIEILDE